MDWIRTYLIVAPIAFIIGVISGHFLTRYFLKKWMEKWQKKMEEPDKEQVRNMLTSLGKKPSEEQVNRFINMAKGAEKKKSPKLKKSLPKKKK